MMRAHESWRARVRATLLAVAGVSLLWGTSLLGVGGFDLTFLGLRLRSNNPQRVFVVTAIALAGFFMAGGTIPLSQVRAGVRRASAAAARHPGWIACLIALASMLAAWAGSTRIAGGADAYGYVSQADLWLRGDLRVAQTWVAQAPWPDATWTFTPLGYRPAASDSDWSIVPTYSPGLPILLAAAKMIGGQCAMFAVVPLLGGLAVLVTYGLGLRLHSPAAGLIAAWLVAASPVMLGSLEPLTDVPVMAAWTIAFYFLLGTSNITAAVSGLFAALAILIRPNLVPLAVTMGAWLLIRRSDLDRRQSKVASFALFAGMVLVGIAAVSLINQHLYGSATTSGYGRLQDQFAWSRVAPNLRRYLSWLADTETPIALLGFLPFFVPSRRFWPDVRDRSVLAMIAAVIVLLWGMYAAYLEFDSWGYLRFVLPSWPFIMLGIAVLLISATPPRLRWIAGVAAVALGLWTIAIAFELEVYQQRQAARHEAPIGRLVRAHTPENSVILAFERSGSVRYYAGRVTLRYDLLDGQWLDRAVEWLESRSIRVYAVLDERQAAEAKQRFSTQRRAAAFDRPVLTYSPAGTSLFDLSAHPDSAKPPVVITEAFKDAPGCDPPVARLPLVVR